MVTLYDSQAVKDGTNIQFRIYYKNQGITEYIILDSKSENESMKKYIYSKYSQNQLKEAEHEYQQYSKFSHCEGRISIPLKENANIGKKDTSMQLFSKNRHHKHESLL